MIFFTGLSLFLSTEKGQQYVKNQVSSFLSDQYDLDIKIDHVKIDLLKHLVFEKTTIVKDNETLLSCDKLFVKTNLVSLLSGILNIDELGVEGAEVDISKLLAQIPKKSKPKNRNSSSKLPIEIGIKEIHLRRIKTQFKDQKQSFVALLESLDLSLDSFDLTKRLIQARKLKIDGLDVVFQQLSKGEKPLVFDWKIAAQLLSIEKSNFKFLGKDNKEIALLKNIETKISDIFVDNQSLQANIEKLSLTDEKVQGILHEFTGVIKRDSNTIAINNIQATYNTSTFKSDFYFDMSIDEEKKISLSKSRMTLTNSHAKVEMSDILKYLPRLADNKFIQSNKNRSIIYSGDLSLKNNRLETENTHFKIPNILEFSAQANISKISDPKNMYLSIKVNNLTTTAQRLVNLLNIQDLPPNILLLDRLNFSGLLVGPIDNYIAKGDLQTSIGKVSTRINMNVKNGYPNAKYNGDISLQNFNLQSFLGDTTLGYASLNAKVVGQHLTADKLQLDINGLVESIDFKGNTFKNIDVDGKIAKKYFEGKLDVKDKFANLQLNGIIDYSAQLPKIDAIMDIKHLDVFKINLSKKPLILSGKVDADLIGNTIDNLNGKILASNLIVQFAEKKLELGNINLSVKEKDLLKSLVFESSLVNANISGDFKLSTVSNDFLHLIQSNHPKSYDLWISKFAKEPTNTFTNKNIDFDISINDKERIIDNILGESIYLEKTQLEGVIDFQKKDIFMIVKSDSLQFRDFSLDSVCAQINDKRGFISIQTDFQAFNIKKNTIAAGNILIDGTEENLQTKVSVGHINEIVSSINLNTKVSDFSDKKLVFNFENSSFDLGGEKWKILSSLPIQYSKNKLVIDELKIQNNNQIISINVDDTYAKINTSNVDLSILNPILKDERFIFGGLANIQAEINDLFLMENIELSGSIPDLTINKDSWGKVTYSFKTPNLKDEVVGYVTVAKDDFKLKVNSTLTPKNKQNKLEDHQIFVQAKLEKFPFKFFDYFLGDNVKDSEGTISGDINLKGGLKNPTMKVIAIPSNVATTVSYLNARYSLTDNTVNIDNKMFDFSKCKLIDELGNTATIRGGFTHDFFKKFRLDIDVKSDNFLLLNTTRDNNPDYFGKGIGKADVSFKGSFLTPTIDIKVATNKGTIFNIPLDNSDFTKSSLDFLTFTNFSDTTTTEKKTLSGVNLNMDIQVTNDALMRILFNEQQGDIIQSKGSGNVKLNYTIVGDMNVFGTYQIDKGDYLFTYQNLVNKPFDILPGGTITWNGNPYKAQLNIKAQYSQKSPVTNFIYEYLSSEENNLVNEAGNATSVDLIMNITGLLDQPIINFDFQFPQISGPIKSYVETKLRSLRNDQNELNRQVFALVVLGTFLPSNDSGGTFGSGNQILNNTLNELISNQISMYLSDIISQAFEDVKFIDDVRFNLDYRTYDNTEGFDVNDFNTNNQVGVGIQNTLLNNKLLISIGGNFDVGRSNGVQNNTGSYVAGDFLIEYRITSDGRFRLKAYQTTQSAIEGRRSKTGVGISYRNEFDTFADFVNNLKKSGNKKTK